MKSIAWLLAGGVLMALAYVLPTLWTFRQIWMPKRTVLRSPDVLAQEPPQTWSDSETEVWDA